MRSLTGRLVAGVLLAELLCAVCFSVVAIAHEMQVRRRAFDVMLRGRADSLLGAVQDADDPEANVAVDQSELRLPAEDIYVVLSPSGRLLGASPNPDAKVLQAPRSSRVEGFFNVVVDGIHYRALVTQGVRVIDRLENGGTRRPVWLAYAAPTHRLHHEVFEAARFYILTSALLLAVTGIVLAWLLRRWLSPLRDLALSASQVSVSSWEFTPPDNALQTRELTPIVASIRQLLAGLREAFERQQRFTGDAAHELKTSLALIKSSLQLMTLGPRSAQQYEAGLNELEVDVRRMENQTERMLTLARLEEEPVTPGELIDLGKIVQSSAERLRSFAEAKQVAISLPFEAGFLVRMHPGDAETLASNLLLNALQHGPKESQVRVSLTELDGVTEMRVCDRGDGIPGVALPHIFERFYRTDASRSRQSGGTGLGLAICKAIVERSQGTIRVLSTSGQGTEIIVTLPIAPK